MFENPNALDSSPANRSYSVLVAGVLVKLVLVQELLINISSYSHFVCEAIEVETIIVL